ncbi:MAG: thioredoxin [Candidatus Aminicenantes bacterium]|nr:thioredoxin [Candidatus Aminicenantes bacterium]
MSTLEDIKEIDFEKRVIESDIPVVVDFWAPWCGACLMMSPVLESLAAEMEGRVRIVKVNTDENFSVARTYGIMAIPTLILFKGGREADRLTGLVPQTELKAWVNNSISIELHSS